MKENAESPDDVTLQSHGSSWGAVAWRCQLAPPIRAHVSHLQRLRKAPRLPEAQPLNRPLAAVGRH